MRPSPLQGIFGFQRYFVQIALCYYCYVPNFDAPSYTFVDIPPILPCDVILMRERNVRFEIF